MCAVKNTLSQDTETSAMQAWVKKLQESQPPKYVIKPTSVSNPLGQPQSPFDVLRLIPTRQ